jgi:hypothetical protein
MTLARNVPIWRWLLLPIKYFPFTSSIEIIRILGHIYHILFCIIIIIIIIIIAINDQSLRWLNGIYTISSIRYQRICWWKPRQWLEMLKRMTWMHFEVLHDLIASWHIQRFFWWKFLLLFRQKNWGIYYGKNLQSFLYHKIEELYKQRKALITYWIK